MESNYSFMLYMLVITVTGVKGLLDMPSQHSYTELYSMIQTMNQTINQMKQNIASLKTENVQLKQQLSAVQVQSIGFYASLSHEISTVGDNQAIEYDSVITNVGNGYDSRHGHFTAPVNGIYMFTVTAMGEPNEAIELSIVKNGIVVGKPRSDMSNDLDSGTAAITLSLVKGDMVWVKYGASYGTNSRKLNGHDFNTFSGALIAVI